MPGTSAKTKAATVDADGKVRPLLAGGIVVAGIIGILAISIAVIWTAKDHASAARYVFAGVVPLISTWVGAVIAFYFTRGALEAAQAATESTLRATGALTADSPVSNVMIPLAKIGVYQLQTGQDVNAVRLAELLSAMPAGRHRIPILDPSGAVVYVVHDSTINAISTAPTTDTVATLLANADANKALKAIGIVGPNAVIADARAAMSAMDGCNDVFVTKAGQRTDPVVGWLTNTDLAGIE